MGRFLDITQDWRKCAQDKKDQIYQLEALWGQFANGVDEFAPFWANVRDNAAQRLAAALGCQTTDLARRDVYNKKNSISFSPTQPSERLEIVVENKLNYV